MTAAARLTIVRPGMLTTIQDLGRWGWQASGVPVAGPMDEYSHRAANRLVGNDEHAAALEVTLIGPELESDRDVVCAVAGAQFALDVGGTAVGVHQPFVLRAGARLRFGTRTLGARATLAIRGGIRAESAFDSRATSLISRIGPFDGRGLKAGDILEIEHHDGERRGVDRRPRALPLPTGGARLRVIEGPHRREFVPVAWERLFASRFVVTPTSNRMGYRLDGPALTRASGVEILSDATPIGSLQVPPSGMPILLMADRQTTGGYPKIATVITADLPLAGQLAPGDWIEFASCTREAALAALKDRWSRLDGA